MEQPLVSIVTITRNRGNLLRRCISSILNQTYHNIEHIVVDGASDDNTDEVITEFKDVRLHYYKLDYNWPIKETQTFAHSKCQGKYITFLDSDDEYLPDKIEKQVALFESLSEEYGLVYCWMTYYDSSNNNKKMYTHGAQLKGYVPDEVVGTNIISGTPTMMFRMSFWKNFEGWKSPEEIGIGSDWEMCARACQQTKIDFVPKSLVNVYVNHGSVRESEAGKYYDEIYSRRIKFHKHFLTYFADNFRRHPEKAKEHYKALSQCYSTLKERKEAFMYTYKYAKAGGKVKDTVKQLIKIILGR